MRRLRAQAVSLCGAANRRWGEDGALDDHARGGRCNLAARAPHHAGKGEGGAFVGDHQVCCIEAAHLVVERLEALPLLGEANLHGVAHLGTIKRVRRLAELQHDVVGGIHNVRDRAEAGRLEAHLHSIRRCGNFQSVDHAQHHMWRQGLIGNA